MFNVGGGEILVIVLVALLVLGPDKLPEAARTAGKVMRQVRDISQGFQTEVRQAMAEVTDTTPNGSAPDVHPAAGAGPSLPAAPAAPSRPDPDGGTWRTDGPTTSFT